VTHDNWKVSQFPKCDILTSISVDPVAVDYDASKASETVYTSAQMIGNIRDTSGVMGCALTGCTVTQGGGDSALVDPFDSLFSIAESNPVVDPKVFDLKISQT